MSSTNGNQIRDHFTVGEVPIYGTLNEQCLMVEQKSVDATTMLNHPTAPTALDPIIISDPFDFMHGNGDEQLRLNLNNDIDSLSISDPLTNEDVPFNRTECHGKIISNNSNLENVTTNSHLENGMFVSASGCTASYTADKNSMVLPSSSGVTQCFTSSSEITAEVSNSGSESPARTRPRIRCVPIKEKLYMKSEPFSDEQMEIKRLNALKAKKNRLKQKDMFDALKKENAKLQNELLENKSKIKELQDVILALEENQKQKNQSLCLLRDQLFTIIDQ